MQLGLFAKAWGHRFRDRWLWAGFGLIAAAYYWFHFKNISGGGELYRHTAQCLWDRQVLQACDFAFTYPPAFAFVMLPSAAMPMWLMLLIWYGITLACAIWCCRICEEIVVRTFPGEWPARDREWLRLFALLVSLKFILAGFEYQGYDFLVLPMTLGGILALINGRDISAGVCLAAAAALKVTPLIFLPYLLFKARFTAALAFVVAFVAVSFLPDLAFWPHGGPHGYFLAWIHDVAIAGVSENASAAPYAFWTGANPYNLSLRGAVALALDGTPYQPDFVWWLRLVQMAFIAVVGVMLLASRRKKMVAIDGALLIISMLMLAPMTSRDHFVLLLLPYYLIVAGTLRDRRTAWVGIASLIVSFSLSGIPREIVPRAFSEFMKMHSDMVFATMVLLIYLGMMIRTPERWGIDAAEPGDEAKQAAPVASFGEIVHSP
jgi:hypothetical protein